MADRTESIDRIRKRFQREWLLIRVVKMDKATTTPRRGILLAHSKDRDAILHKSLRDRRHLLIMCSEDTLPKGFAAAFHA